MSNAPIVTVQLGQCGNQVGGAFFEQLAQQLVAPAAPSSGSCFRSSSSQSAPLQPVPLWQQDAFQRGISSRFFRPAHSRRSQAPLGSDPDAGAAGAAAGAVTAAPLPVARAVLVDMEPKVIQQALSAAGRSSCYQYDERRTFYRQSGSGNNWAYGYAKHGPECRESILNLVRLEVESCDTLGGLLVSQSLAGGTGSGVGTFLTECLADAYPETLRLNQVVWPYRHGEVIVQNYNALLTLASLYESSDGIIVFENDSLHSVCSRRLSLKTPSFSALNRVIGESLVNIVAPAVVTQATPFYASTNDDPSATASSLAKERRARLVPPADAELLSSCPPLQLWSDPAAHLFAHPGFKLSTIRTIPQLSQSAKSFSTAGWRYLLKHLAQMGLQAAPMEDGLDWSVASYAVAEGAALAKRRWHKHHSASARAAGLYDPYTTFDATTTTAAATAIAAAATGVSGAAAGAGAGAGAGGLHSPGSSAPVVPSSSSVPFDAPMPAPAYMRAFMDGESYLECRLLEQVAAQAEGHGGHGRGQGHGSSGRGSSTARPSSSSSHRPSSSSSTSPPGAGAGSAPDDPSPSYSCALSQLLYLRGSSVCSADASAFLDPSLYAPSSLNPLQVVRSATQIHGDERLATAWSNGQSVVPPLDHMLDKIYAMLQAKAYTHHYRKWGIDTEHLWQQVTAMEQVCSDYKRIAL